MSHMRTAPLRGIAMLLAIAGLLVAIAALSPAHAEPILGEDEVGICPVSDGGGLPSAELNEAAGTMASIGDQDLAARSLARSQPLVASAVATAAEPTAEDKKVRVVVQKPGPLQVGTTVNRGDLCESVLTKQNATANRNMGKIASYTIEVEFTQYSNANWECYAEYVEAQKPLQRLDFDYGKGANFSVIFTVPADPLPRNVDIKIHCDPKKAR
jgi:hypothetical protein